MKKVVFDLETNGLMDLPWERRSDPVSTIHCAVTYSEEEGTVRWVFPKLKDMFLAYMEKADCLVGHNIVGYDLPVLEDLWDWKPKPSVQVLDTRIACEMSFPDHRLWKMQNSPDTPTIPNNLVRRHSLEAWGLRIGEHKDTFGKTADWHQFSEEMLDYCEQDVLVNTRLLQFLLDHAGYSEESMILESAFARVMWYQRLTGIRLDVDGAKELALDLLAQRDVVEAKLKERFQPWLIANGDVLIPKRDNKTRGYIKDCPVQKLKWQELKPASRFHVARCLGQLGWIPKEFNNDGSAKVDRSILRALPYEEAEWFATFEELNKKIAMISEGPSAWLKKTSWCDITEAYLLHGRVNTTGTRTGRCTHTSPNCAQVPRVGTPYGKEMRALFQPPKGRWAMVGADASGLELRMLAHYCGAFDGGEMASLITEGDIHSTTAAAVGISRSAAKTWMYANLYGAGDHKLGVTIAKDQGLAVDDDKKLIAMGKKSRVKVMDKLKGLGQLTDAVKAKAKDRGYLLSLDGRRIYDDQPHSALNSLLQGAGAVVMKKATVLLAQSIEEEGLQVEFMLNVHDEYQLAVADITRRGLQKVCDLAVEAIRESGHHFNLRCPLDGEAKVGANWSETH